MRPQFLRAAARSRSQHSPRHSCGRLGYNYGYSCAVAGRSRSFATTVPRTAEVELTIDGKKVSIEAGSALIQACEKAGVTIPRYCYHEKLLIAGNCRMCLVEVERAPKPVASCAWPVQPGMVVKTNSPLTHKAREGVMEFLLANHPLDCPICDQGGECDLQDQSMRYGADRGRFHEVGGKRAVEDKNIGPLIKTSMNRCIHCTRCVRFANDIAGAPELGTTGRGNEMQIGTYLEKNLDSELSGNVIDLCPVGALTSKPYAFRARPWELQHTESIDVLDALGSNIRVDARGMEVMRILPRLNDDVNEEWINDKTRFACDGLRTQRLTTPLVRKANRFVPVTWEQALTEIGGAFRQLAPKANEFKAIAGHLVETESLVAMKDLVNNLGSDNLALDQPGGGAPIAHGVDVRSNYLFNSKIYGIEEADAILLVATNPRHEAAVLNARIRKQYLRSDLHIGLVGETFASTFDFEHLGTTTASLKSTLAGPFGKTLASAKRPMIIVGSAAVEHPDAKAIFETVGAFVDKNATTFNTPEWQGYNVLQRAASRAGAYEVGFTTPSPEIAATQPKIVWLLGADEVTEADIPKSAFVIYQGHHGDRGAQLADVVLPGTAYTEKSGTYVNLEGRVQMTRAATSPPGAARDDWKIIRAASEFLGAPLPYDDVEMLRDRMEMISPALRRYDVVENTSSVMSALSKVQLVDQNRGAAVGNQPFRRVVENFYFTDSISRSSPTMARCSAAKETGNPDTNFMIGSAVEEQQRLDGASRA
ncbi:NADH-ubiquinone oxidoreductase 78 kDa subunit, mitochondrial [[Emmonsia] crescens]|uniref:NADH-ubiquinone oxidoreductase 78 kDa subunit, mitochondrial n=1 Tax=[Emmonsia] crescens TaxID=73230 RepID=A0A2B7Z0X1_9EURO|nr:NADH-ubiquinone oxidoreductase 78 kDa subunit, mitochondrial [Emmonsia crescens]